MLIAMVLKGLPDSYKAFSTIITQTDSDKMNFQKFKASLRSYEESELSRTDNAVEKDTVFSTNCFKCGKPGHIKKYCRSNKPNKNFQQRRRWCKICQTSTHDTDICYKNKSKSQSKVNSNKDGPDEEYFVFKLSVHERDIVSAATDRNLFLVDCGATTHIVSDPKVLLVKIKVLIKILISLS